MPYSVAAPWKRLFATLYDSLILTAISLLYGAFATVISTQVFNNSPENYLPNTNGAAVLGGWVITLLAFYCFFWLKVGQTVAMKAWRIKLVRDSGEELTLLICLMRCTLGFVGLACFGLSYLWAFFDKEKLSLHDRLTGTRIIQLSKDEA